MYTNIRYNKFDTIDCDYDHPVYGIIPTTLDPSDPETADKFADILAGNHGVIASYVAPVKTAEQLAAENNAPLLAEIAALEQKCIRSVRELALDPSDVDARQYLRQSDDAIAALRGQLL